MADQRALIGPTEAPRLHLMTWNIRRPVPRLLGPAADAWTRRRREVHALLQRERPTILAAQEVMPEQSAVIKTALGANYRGIGHGRNADGSGEGCPIFFDSERLTLSAWEQRALSETPEQAGSRSWGSVFPRIAVIATFTDRQTGHALRVINTHIDPFLHRTRARSAAHIGRIAMESSVPTLVFGDFNSSPHSLPMRALAEVGIQDAWERAEQKLTPDWGTLGNYRAPRPNGRRIDWILATESVTVHAIAINARRGESGWGSDHLPVQVTVQLQEDRTDD